MKPTVFNYADHEALQVKCNSLEFENGCLESSVDSLEKTAVVMQAELARVTAERDRALAELNDAQPCFACINFRNNEGECFGAGACRTRLIYEQAGLPLPRKDFSYGLNWQWRGTDKETTK